MTLMGARTGAETTITTKARTCRLSPAGFAITALLALCFVFFSRLPLWHTDLWGHLAYGRWIVEQHAVPRIEPLMPLSRGIPFIDLAWLSQVLGYAVISRGGAPAMQCLHAATITVCVAILMYGVSRKTRGA